MTKITQGEAFNYMNSRHQRVLEKLKTYVRLTGDHDLYGGKQDVAAKTLMLFKQCAADWANQSQIMPSDMPKWWKAGAFEPEAVQALLDAGIGLTLAKRSRGETCEEIDTFAYHVSMGSMSVEQVAERVLN